jgi:(5-formylfuran-3-yl)methyl phosphate synthase
MKVLISVVSVEEARIALKGKPDILDIKNTEEGSLGAQFPWIIKDIVDEIKGTVSFCSAALGDLSYKPGTAALAAYGAALCGVDYVKAGLFGTKNYSEAFNMMNGIVNSVRMVNKEIIVVASGYADYTRFGGIPYKVLVKVAKNSGSDVVMVDTAIKDGKDLFNAMCTDEIKDFIDLAHDNGLKVALAGSVKRVHLELLSKLNPDIIGVRGDVCENGDRTTHMSEIKIKEFMEYAMALI